MTGLILLQKYLQGLASGIRFLADVAHNPRPETFSACVHRHDSVM